MVLCFFFNDTATTEIYTLPYTTLFRSTSFACGMRKASSPLSHFRTFALSHSFFRSEEHTSELQSQSNLVCRLLLEKKKTTAVCAVVLRLAADGLVLRAAGLARRLHRRRVWCCVFFLMIRRPPRSTLFPTRRSSDLHRSHVGCERHHPHFRTFGLSHFRTPSLDRKSTRLNSSHSQISYAVFCLKKKRRLRYALLYFVSLLTGSFCALLVSPDAFTVGAYGAVFFF